MAASFWQRLNLTRRLFTEEEVLGTLDMMSSQYCAKKSVDSALNKLRQFKAGFLSKKLKQSIEEARKKTYENVDLGVEWKRHIED